MGLREDRRLVSYHLWSERKYCCVGKSNQQPLATKHICFNQQTKLKKKKQIDLVYFSYEHVNQN
jgi:hypothetical protein